MSYDVRKEKITDFILFVSCFCITISHLVVYSLSIFRWIGIGLITLGIVRKASRCGFEKKATTGTIIVFTVMSLCTILCETTFTQKAVSEFYFAVLCIWLFYSERFIQKKDNFLFMSLGGGSACIVGLILTRSYIGAQLRGVYSSRIRVYGGFSHPNILGAMLATAFLEGLLYLYLLKENEIKLTTKVVLIAYEIVLAGLVISTNSRTAMVMLTGAVLVLLSIKLKKFHVAFRLIFYSIVVGLALYVINNFVVDYMLNDAAFGGRIRGLISNDYNIVQKIVGHGMTGSEDTIGAHGKEIAWASIYFKTGGVGVVTYICMIVGLIIKAVDLKNIRQKKAAWACLVFMILSTLGDPYIINIANSASLFMWAGTSAMCSKSFNMNSEKVRNFRRGGGF